MSIAGTIIGSIFGHNPIAAAIDGLNKAYETKLNAATESQKIEADRQIALYRAVLDDLQKARESAKTMPWWLAFPMAIVAFTGAFHVSMIFVASTFSPLLDRTSGLGRWLLNIPQPPGDYASYEAEIIVFFFGGAVILAGVKTVASVLGRK